MIPHEVWRRASRCALSTPALILLLAACGGGGGGGGNPNPAPVNQTPTASFTISATTGNAPLNVSVDADASADADGQIASYAWDFDGTPGIGAVAQHTFEDPGTFEVRLTVTDDDGATSTTTRTVTVEAAVVTSTLSGKVRILSSTAVDSDVNDRLTVPQSNNSFTEAQDLLSPVTLGGFANVAGTGENTGNLFAAGDPRDFYHISLAGNETIVLTIADGDADLDLRLWDDGFNIVDASLNVNSETETIEVTQAGTYYIEVLPFSGASNYVLYVGQTAAASSTSLQRNAVRLSDPFIDNQLIVKHRQSQPVRAPDGTREMVAPLRADRTRQQAELVGPELPGLYRLTKHSQHSPALPLPAGARVSAAQRSRLATLYQWKRLAQDPTYEYAELNLLHQPHLTPNDAFYASQWHYPAINLPLAWDTEVGDANVIVAVVDTGVLLNHPDLAPKLVAGYDFISDADRARDGDGIDPNPDDPGDLEFGGSSSFHGTHVAGTVGAVSNNGEGVAGVAWNTSIMPLRALGTDGGSTFDIVQAVRFAAGLSNNSGTVPAQRADIINLSLGSSFSSQSEQDAYTAAVQAGVIVIASAGNESSDLPSYPSAYDGVVSVSATTITNDIATYSNSGATIDIAAPGGSNITDLNGDGIGDGVISTMGDDSGGGAIEFGYLAISGTSMAAPHVAGVASLMKAIHPGLTPVEFETAMVAGQLTDDLGSPGRDDVFGYGLINAQKAVFVAQQLANGQGVDPGPILTASASVLNFGGFIDSLKVTLQNVGSGTVNIANVSSSEPWLTTDAPGSADGLGEYTVNLDRTGLADGAYQATITFASDANDVEVGVIMQVSSANVTADAGLFYIILVDENGDTLNALTELVLANQGEYPFTLTDVPAGQYRLFAGTDADDDARLCDAGEACGAYPTLDAPDFLAINDDRDDLDFEAGFRVNLTTTTNAVTSDAGTPSAPTVSKPQERPQDAR